MGLGTWMRPRHTYAAAPDRAGRIWTATDWGGVHSQAAALGPIGRDKAMGLPGIGRGVRLTADVAGQLVPNSVKHVDDPRTPVEVLDRPAVLTDPDPTWHGRVTWQSACVRDMMLEGNTFADKTVMTDRLGYPIVLPLIAPDRVTWEPTRQRGRSGRVYHVTGPDGAGRREVEPGDMFHAAVDVDSGQRMGRGILHTHQDALKLIAATERATFVVMRDGKPVGVLSSDVDMTEDELKAMKASFIEGVAGDGIAALMKATFEHISWNAQDLALVPAREHHLRLAADVTGVSPYLLGVPSESRVYANVADEWSNLVKVTIARYIGPLQDALSKCLPRGTVVRFNTDDIQRPDAKTRWENWRIATEIGAMSVEEIRQEERLGPRLSATEEATP